MLKSHRLCTLALLSTALMLAGCDSGKPAAPLAPSAERLEPPKPKSVAAIAYAVTKGGSSIEFSMEAPIEQITGRVRDAVTGEVKVDLTDLSKTTALITADIGSLVLTQRKKANTGDAAYGDETKQDKQNEHARGWLEIDDKNPDHETHRRVQLTVTSVKADATDVTKLTGDERKVKATVSGEFLLHGRKTAKTVDVEVTFTFKDGQATALRVRSVKPFAVGLEEHDVRPRDALGKLANTLLSELSDKVAKEAQVSLDFTAQVLAPSSAPTSSAPTSSAPTSSAPNPK